MATEAVKPFYTSFTLWGLAAVATAAGFGSHMHPLLALVLTWGGIALAVLGRIRAGKLSL